jgi:hypothetical protein
MIVDGWYAFLSTYIIVVIIVVVTTCVSEGRPNS